MASFFKINRQWIRLLQADNAFTGLLPVKVGGLCITHSFTDFHLQQDRYQVYIAHRV